MNVWFIPPALLTAAFLRSVLTGMLIGVCCDLTRAPRRVFRVGRAASTVLDGLFVLALLVLVFCFFVVGAYGVPRGWFVCGIGLGAALYFFLLSPLVLLVLVTILAIVQKSFVFLEKTGRKAAGTVGRWAGRQMQREKLRKKSKFLFHFRTK